MSMQVSFFMWCTIINGSLLFFWALMFMIMPNMFYRIQTKFFPMSQETFNVIMYGFLGLFKVAFIIFNLVPYIVLLIISP